MVGRVLVACSGQQLRARAVILATGSRLRMLGVAGEDVFTGWGISTCASCDGPLFRDARRRRRRGESVVQKALVLATHAGKVTIVHDGPELAAQPALARRLADVGNVELRASNTIREVRGERIMKSVVIAGPDGEEEVEAGGLFVFIGLDPNGELAERATIRDRDGRLAVDGALRVDARGLYAAAGDVRVGSVCRLSAAAGDGAAAAIAGA